MLFDGATNTNNPILIVDLAVQWGHAFKAFAMRDHANEAGAFYLGFHQESSEAEWFDVTSLDWMSKALQSKLMSFAGFEWKSMTPPDEHMQAPPSKACAEETGLVHGGQF